MKTFPLKFGPIIFTGQWPEFDDPAAVSQALAEEEKRRPPEHPLALNFFEDRDQHLWVLSSMVQVGVGGYYEDAPPVRIIQHGDRDKLMTVLLELLNEDVPVVKPPKFGELPLGLALRPAAVNAKGNIAYLNRTRCFILEKKEGHFLLEEWPQKGRSWTGNASWRKKFPLDQFEKLVDALIRRTKPKIESKPKRVVPRTKVKKVTSRTIKK
jgi:hypothetical protein